MLYKIPQNLEQPESTAPIPTDREVFWKGKSSLNTKVFGDGIFPFIQFPDGSLPIKKPIAQITNNSR